MQLSDYADRSARTGKGLLPPNPRQWDAEHHGLDLRRDLALDLVSPLDHAAAFRLLPNTRVLPHGDVPAADVYLEHFRGAGSTSWSGFALTVADGHELIVYNDSHPVNRTRATLMEEFFHLRLNHPRSMLRVFSNGDSRSHDPEVEDEAYCSGAAALVPYFALKRMVDANQNAASIAKLFKVSRELVVFRAKVTRCYRALRRRR